MTLSAFTEKFGFVGSIVAAMGCASCFPLLGSIGATLGLGALAQFEGVFINTLLPVFAVIALLSVIVSWWSHRRLFRALLGIAGPVMVLATLYLFWVDSWSTYMFYGALLLMLLMTAWDLISPPSKTCKAER